MSRIVFRIWTPQNWWFSVFRPLKTQKRALSSCSSCFGLNSLRASCQGLWWRNNQGQRGIGGAKFGESYNEFHAVHSNEQNLDCITTITISLPGYKSWKGCCLGGYWGLLTSYREQGSFMRPKLVWPRARQEERDLGPGWN